MNTPQPGDRVLYHGRHGNELVNGFLAERFVSQLTGNPRYRVVDNMSEAKDTDAGRIIGIDDVVRFDND